MIKKKNKKDPVSNKWCQAKVLASIPLWLLDFVMGDRTKSTAYSYQPCVVNVKHWSIKDGQGKSQYVNDMLKKNSWLRDLIDLGLRLLSRSSQSLGLFL